MHDWPRLDVIQCTTGLEVRLLAALHHERKLRQYTQERVDELSKLAEGLAHKLAERDKEPEPLPPPPPPCILDLPAHRVCASNATMKQIQIAVCDRFNLTLGELRSQRRQAHLLLARQCACMLIRALTSKSFPEIGRAFGNKDHSTILHAARKFAPIYERLCSELTPEDTLATWVKHAYNMVMREKMPMARPKGRPPKPVERADNLSAPVLNITKERASFAMSLATGDPDVQGNEKMDAPVLG